MLPVLIKSMVSSPPYFMEKTLDMASFLEEEFSFDEFSY